MACNRLGGKTPTGDAGTNRATCPSSPTPPERIPLPPAFIERLKQSVDAAAKEDREIFRFDSDKPIYAYRIVPALDTLFANGLDIRVTDENGRGTDTYAELMNDPDMNYLVGGDDCVLHPQVIALLNELGEMENPVMASPKGNCYTSAKQTVIVDGVRFAPDGECFVSYTDDRGQQGEMSYESLCTDFAPT